MENEKVIRINVADLEKIISFFLSNVKKTVGNEIDLNKDFYWEISSEEIYDPYNNPKDLTLGQLSFDWEELQKLLVSDHIAIYDLKRVAEILRWLSIEYPIAF